MESIKKDMWECPVCYKAHETERNADTCIYHHFKERCINHDFMYGFGLGAINQTYNMHWILSEKQGEITKDSCFVISYLQGCRKPAYRILYISHTGKITVRGKGSWSGSYSAQVALHCLTNPRPIKELFIDPR